MIYVYIICYHYCVLTANDSGWSRPTLVAYVATTQPSNHEAQLLEPYVLTCCNRLYDVRAAKLVNMLQLNLNAAAAEARCVSGIQLPVVLLS